MKEKMDQWDGVSGDRDSLVAADKAFKFCDIIAAQRQAALEEIPFSA